MDLGQTAFELQVLDGATVTGGAIVPSNPGAGLEGVADSSVDGATRTVSFIDAIALTAPLPEPSLPGSLFAGGLTLAARARARSVRGGSPG